MSKMSSKAASKSSNKKEKGSSVIANGYLFLYNFLQTVGWSFLLYQIVAFYALPKNDGKNLYETVKYTLLIFQNAAALEILHAITRLVPSNPVITTFQVLSRVMVVCGVLLPTPTAKVSPGLPLCLLAWAITEIIRYLYYTLNIINAVPHILVWLRYTTFIILYPVGVTGELLCFYAAQSYVAETRMWTVTMPNMFNFIFNYHYVLLGTMLLYIPLFPQMYLHMFAQRKKILGGPSASTKKQKQ